MPIKKSELYSSIWRSCDELRGGMDASQYKDYLLVLLFVKYVSQRSRFAANPSSRYMSGRKWGHWSESGRCIAGTGSSCGRSLRPCSRSGRRS